MNEAEYQAFIAKVNEQCKTSDFRERIKKAEKLAVEFSLNEERGYCENCGMKIDDCRCEG
jgi:hypothetical protein